MEVPEIVEFENKLKNLTLVDMKDPRIIGRLGKLYVLLGDLFMMRVPRGSTDLMDIQDTHKFNERRARLKSRT